MITSRFHPVIILFALIGVSFALGGCDIFSSQDSYQPAAQGIEAPSASYLQMAPTAPPPSREETPPMLDNMRSEVWRPGYWSYSGSSFNWVSGEVIARPSSTAVWSPDHWIEHTYGWAFIPGYWQ